MAVLLSYLLLFSSPAVERVVISEAAFWDVVSSFVEAFIMMVALHPVWITCVEVCFISQWCQWWPPDSPFS